MPTGQMEVVRIGKSLSFGDLIDIEFGTSEKERS